MSNTTLDQLPENDPDKKRWPDKIELIFLRGLIRLSVYHVTPNGLKLLKMMCWFLLGFLMILVAWKMVKD